MINGKDNDEISNDYTGDTTEGVDTSSVDYGKAWKGSSEEGSDIIGTLGIWEQFLKMKVMGIFFTHC